MGWIFSLLGTAGSLLLIPMGFAIGVYIPLVITDTAFQVYSTIGLSNFARQLFGSTNGIGVNWHNGFSIFLLYALIAGIIAFVFSLGANLIANLTKASTTNWRIRLSMISYGVASISLVPLAFIFMTTITSLLFNVLSGNSSTAFITNNERNDFVSVIQAYGGKFYEILNKDFLLNGDSASWEQSLDKLVDWIQQIQTQAATQGMTSLQNACDKIIQDITSVKTECSAENLSTLMNQLATIASGMTIGQRLSDIAPLQSVYDSIYNSSQCFSNLLTDLENIKQYSNAFSSNPTIADLFVNIFGGNLADGSRVEGWMGFVQYGGDPKQLVTDHLYSIMNIFQNQSVPSYLEVGKYINYTSGINQILGGCTNNLNPTENHYWTTGAQPIVPIKDWIGVDEFYQRANPLPTFTLAGMINAFILGQGTINSNYDVWNIYGSAFSNFLTGHMERVVVGMMIANMTMATMMGYAYYMVGRIFELVVLWLASVIAAFKDAGEGTQFKIIMKATFTKTLSIIFIEFVFTITNVIINKGFIAALINSAADSSTGWFDATNAAIMLATTIGFTCSYYLGNSMCTLVLGEAGQLRSFGDQYANISSTGRQQYGYGTKSTGGQVVGAGAQAGSGALKAIDKHKTNKAWGGEFDSMIKLGGTGGNKKAFIKTGGKAGAPTMPTKK